MGVTSFVQNGLVRIAYEVAGEGAPVVLLHGMLGDRVTMRPLADALIAGHRVVSIDLRGHGGSSAIHGAEVAFADLASDIAAVLDAAGIEAAPVVGVDLGAAVAAHLGDRATCVVAVNPVEQLTADIASLGSIADDAYKGLGDKAVNGWLDIAWGSDWRDRVPRPRVAAARRNVQGLHGYLSAVVREGAGSTPTQVLTLPGGAPFAEESGVQAAMTALSDELCVG